MERRYGIFRRWVSAVAVVAMERAGTTLSKHTRWNRSRRSSVSGDSGRPLRVRTWHRLAIGYQDLAVGLLAILAATGIARAETVFSNLNTNPSASVGSAFTWYAQRFTTGSAGAGLDLDLNIVSLEGSQSYAIELWSADPARLNVNALLASIGSGVVTSTDRTAITSFTLAYGLDAATDYFVKITSATGSFGLVLGPNSSTTLNSVVRYGVDNLNNISYGDAMAMKVDVAAVPEPAGLAASGLAFCGCLIGWRRWCIQRRYR